MVLKVVFFLFLLLLTYVDSQHCLDHRNDINTKYQWSFYYSDRPSKLTFSFSYDGGKINSERQTKNNYKKLFKTIKDSDMIAFLFSEQGGTSDYAHHKSFLVLNKDYKSGFVLLHTYPDLHNSFIRDEETTMSHTQHMICISLNSKEDVDTILDMYEKIQPFLVYKFEGSSYDDYTNKKTDRPNFPISLPWSFQDDVYCFGGIFGDDTSTKTDATEVTKDLLALNKAKFDACFKNIERNLAGFQFYATVSQRKLKKLRGENTVREFGVDSWWKLTRKLEEQFFMISHVHPDKGFGSIYSKEISIQNIVWDYGNSEASEGYHHDKIAFSKKKDSKLVCLGDGNRDYTQNSRSGFIGCISNEPIHTFFTGKNRIYLNEEYMILDETTEDDLFPIDANYIASRRKFIYNLSTVNKVKPKKRQLGEEKTLPSLADPTLDKHLKLSDGSTVEVRTALRSFIIDFEKEPLGKEIESKEATPNRLHCVQKCLVAKSKKYREYKDGVRIECTTPRKQGGCGSIAVDNFSLEVDDVTKGSINTKLIELLEYMYKNKLISDGQIIARYEKHLEEDAEESKKVVKKHKIK
ncbi:hypothetical protein DLAC_09514 [Tieghemostelium lacteum]|uniref:Endonuclease/exonuclease/phosphatase domain-containing protein n=1 Tax=Tieghemostelium lacteum TaxID=361077 RepID=A0A151Z6H4_TIELA|nr:hypothetical protein DLAC_09514 [Tieghemostelium lacteum]|eukprot:KYQ89563.1 hypothetical protein DLAC_09514 [Tieghemostelium lacteum]